jgi:hypothetical protein
VARITRERAEKVARGHACSHCHEYSYRKIAVKPAPESIEKELGVVWIATRTCGVCKYQSELGLQEDGDIVYES